MRRYLTVILSLLCSVMSTTIAIAQNADVKGWGKTAWGMSEGEIIKLYPEAKRFKENILNISDIAIGGYKYDVSFIFDANNKLKDVFIGVPRGKQILERQFSELEKELSIKYGPPVYRNERPTSVAKEAVSTWTFPSTTIELKYVLLRSPALNMGDYQSLIIHYQPNISKDNL